MIPPMTDTTRRALFALLLLFAGFSACDIKKKDATQDNPSVPEQALEKFSVTETKQGKPHWTLTAESAQIMEAEKKAYLQAPVVKFFKEGEQVSTLTAQKGRINTENYDIWGDGNCVLETNEGERLVTKNLHYVSETQKIVTDEKVVLTRQKEIVTGVGMEATPDLENITIRKQRVEVRE